MLIAAGHDDKDIHVAIGMRRAISMGAEKDNLVGMELLGHQPGEAADDTHRYVGPAIPTLKLRAVRIRFGMHRSILASAAATEGIRQLTSSGRWGLAAKQIPHRPGQAPALGLRAGIDGVFILSQTTFRKEKHHVVLFLAAMPVIDPVSAGPGTTPKSVRALPAATRSA